MYIYYYYHINIIYTKLIKISNTIDNIKCISLIQRNNGESWNNNIKGTTKNDGTDIKDFLLFLTIENGFDDGNKIH